MHASDLIDDFFFKQKTAYEMSASLVGSEMCIRDSSRDIQRAGRLELEEKVPFWLKF